MLPMLTPQSPMLLLPIAVDAADGLLRPNDR
jgi:hypothetical protein